MSLNVGNTNSRYVVVNNVTMRFAFSEKVLFADLRTSRKTGNPKVNKKTGEIITDEHGSNISERTYTHWEGRFVGNAFEPAKALKNGQIIDIINGWVDKEESVGKNGQRFVNVYIIITDFTLSDQGNDGDEPLAEAVEQNTENASAVYSTLDGDNNTQMGGGLE